MKTPSAHLLKSEIRNLKPGFGNLTSATTAPKGDRALRATDRAYELRASGYGWLGHHVMVAMVAILALCLPGRAGAATATPPDQMTYQGFLVDGNGNALGIATPENYPVIFRMYSSATGGSSLWSEQQIVTVDKGRFGVVLGEGTAVGGEPKPALSSVFTGNNASDRYLGIAVTIDGATLEILPRLRLLPTAYSFLATSANQLVQPSGSTVLNYANNRVQVTGNFNATGTISGNGSGLTSLNASAITAGTLDAARLPSSISGTKTFTGNVGLGVNPARRLHVSGPENVMGRFDSSSTVGTWLALGNSSAGGRYWHFISTGSGNGGGAGKLLIGSGNSDTVSSSRMVLQDDGKVGIGTLVPNARLSLGSENISEKLAIWDGGSAGNTMGLGVGAGQFRLYLNPGSSRFTFLDAPNGNELVNIWDSGSTALQVGSFATTASDTYIGTATQGGNRFRTGIKLRHFSDGYGWTLESDERDNGFRIRSHTDDLVGISRVFVDRNFGYVGIGTDSPQTKLHVAGPGRTANGVGNAVFYLHPDGSGSRDITSLGNVVGFFGGDLVASGYIASQNVTSWSDARAKTIVGRSSGPDDLSTLNRLQITDFRWIDSAHGGSRLQKKVIAQEVEEVLPQAVSRLEKAIPNIYAKAQELTYDTQHHRLTLSLAQPHDLKEGDQVDVYTDAGEFLKTPVLALPSANQVTIACATEPKEAFVYGKWVDDYRTVDYDAIAMLNVSATQELHRRLAAAEAEVQALKSSLTELAARDEARQNRTAALEVMVEKLLASTQNPHQDEHPYSSRATAEPRAGTDVAAEARP